MTYTAAQQRQTQPMIVNSVVAATMAAVEYIATWLSIARPDIPVVKEELYISSLYYCCVKIRGIFKQVRILLRKKNNYNIYIYIYIYIFGIYISTEAHIYAFLTRATHVSSTNPIISPDHGAHLCLP